MKFIVCSVCGHKNQLNPKKHKYRPKLCVICRTPLTESVEYPKELISLNEKPEKRRRMPWHIWPVPLQIYVDYGELPERVKVKHR